MVAPAYFWSWGRLVRSRLWRAFISSSAAFGGRALARAIRSLLLSRRRSSFGNFMSTSSRRVSAHDLSGTPAFRRGRHPYLQHLHGYHYRCFAAVRLLMLIHQQMFCMRRSAVASFPPVLCLFTTLVLRTPGCLITAHCSCLNRPPLCSLQTGDNGEQQSA